MEEIKTKTKQKPYLRDSTGHVVLIILVRLVLGLIASLTFSNKKTCYILKYKYFLSRLIQLKRICID